ncbi:SANT domain-containing protein [Plasmodiophora brassicae]
MRKVLDAVLENVKSVDSSILTLVRSGQFWVRFGSAAVRQVFVDDLDPNRFYLYDVIVWDPETMASDIPIHCPHCRQRRSARQAKPGDYNVVHHSWTAGRRVITRDSCYFIVGRTYRCTRCKGTKAPSYTFSAYHEGFLAQLPEFIRVQFPAFLTHRSAVDYSVIEEMRSLTEQGVSIEGYHRMLLEWHTARYSRSQIQWFGSLQHCMKGIGYSFTREMGNSPPQFSSFADPDRYNGFVPSPSYLKYCLVKFHGQVRPLMDLLMQTVSGRILKLDHSFKIPKLIRRFNGEKLVEALFTCCNEFEEPVLQMLTFGASLAELLPALRGFMKRILLNDLTEPSLFVSDRCCQDASLFVEFKHFLRALSLGKALCSNLGAILRSIRENLFHELPVVVHRSLIEIEVVALGAVRIAAQRCLLETIENEDVDIDDTTCERLFDGVIESVTRATNVCAQRILEESSRSSQAVEFAAAVASFVTAVTGATDQLVSLRSISARQRARDLPDSVPSFSWPPSDGRVLSTPSEINDVLDAVYRTLLSEAPDNRVIGYDQEWDVVMSRVGGRFVSSRSRVRTIQMAMTNGEMYLVQVSDGMTNLPRALRTLLSDARIAKVGRQIQHDAAKLFKDFGVPLNNCVDVAVLGKRRGKLSTSKLSLERLMSLVFHVALEKPAHIRVSEHWSGPLSPAQIRYANRDAFAGLALYQYFSRFQDCSTPIPVSDAAPGLRVDIVIGNSKRVASGTIVENSGTSRDARASQHVLLVEVDELSAPGLRIATRNGLPAFQTIKELPVRLPVRLESIRRARECLPLESQSDDVVVLKDIFHWLNDLPVKATNAYQPAFLAAMRDAILVVDPEDKAMVRRKLEETGQLPDDFEAFVHNSRWARARIKRATRRPVEMDEAVQAVVDAYRSAKDPMTNEPLLTEAGLKKIEAMRVHVRKGCLSDPPGFQFYTEVAVDELGLPVYHCSRGTNSLEGGYHRDLYRSMGSFGASLELADAILAEKRHRQLMRASVRHRADVPFFGHYDVWNIELVQELALSVSSRLVYENWHPLKSFSATGEQFGLCRLIKRSDAENGPQSTRQLTGCYAFAAKRFGMAIPIMPMHLPEEFKLFDEAMRQCGKDFTACANAAAAHYGGGRSQESAPGDITN